MLVDDYYIYHKYFKDFREFQFLRKREEKLNKVGQIFLEDE